MMKTREVVFKFKDFFKPNDVLSQWILKLSMARNDFLYVHNRLFDLRDEVGRSGENFYFFRLAVSHYREAIKFLDEYKSEKIVIDFIDKLSQEAKADYKILIESCTPWDKLFVQEVIVPVRNNLFHYFSKEFEDDLEELEDFYTRLNVKGQPRSDVDLIFADDISLKVSFGDIEEEEFKSILTKLVELLVAFIRFIDSSIGTYLAIQKHKVAYFVSSSK